MVAAPKTPPDASRVWVCECEKCGTIIEMSDAALSASPPWPCAQCGESSTLIRPKARSQ
jgi:rRNA maturation endonuclease Nob1